MSVLAFKDIQSKVQELISGAAYFDGQTIALHSGNSLSEVEQALRDLGQAVIVYPIQNFSNTGNGYGAAKVVALVPVLFIFNPEKGTLPIYEMVTNGIGAVIDYFNPNTPQDRFRVEDLEIVESDEGSWGYLVNFSKAAQIT